MYRIELASGEETVFRTIEELATAIRNGVVSNRAKIYHNASQKWLPIEFHPHWKKALELPVGSSHPVEAGHPRIPDLRPSGPQPASPPADAAPVQHHPVPMQDHPAPIQHHPAPVQHHPASVRPHPAPIQQHRAPVQHYSAPVHIPPPVPSPVLELTRPTFTAPSSRPSFSALEAAVALEEPPPAPAVHQDPAPSAAQPSRSWIRGPIKLAVLGVIAIVGTRVVVSAAAPGSESRSLAETAPRPAVAQATTAPSSAVPSEREPGAVLTAGPAFSPAIVTTAQAGKAPMPAPAPAQRPTPPAVPTDSIQAVDSMPTTIDLALPAVPTGDSLAPSRSPSDSGAIGRILRAVTSSKPAPVKVAQ